MSQHCWVLKGTRKKLVSPQRLHLDLRTSDKSLLDDLEALIYL